MRCVYCYHQESRVVDSRPTDEGNSIRRRRECEKCFRRFTTYERIEATPIIVVKKDGRREPFNESKIHSGIIKACEKRPITAMEIETLVNEIMMEVNNLLLDEVPSNKIGEIILNKLRQKDEVAYVRFASVYRDFRDVDTFLNELNKLTRTRRVSDAKKGAVPDEHEV